VAACLLVGCGGGGGGEASIDAAPNYGMLLFDESFDVFPGVWNSTGSFLEPRDFGNPAPGLPFTTDSAATASVFRQTPYAGQSLVVTLDHLSHFEVDGENHLRVRIEADYVEVAWLEYSAVRKNTDIVTTLSTAFGQGGLQLLPGDGFHELRISIDGAGTAFGLGGTRVPINTTQTSVTGSLIRIELYGYSLRSGSDTMRAGEQFVDNVRLYRGP
jgi:hypothetical protein